ncbi:hypothetical protein BDZ45DRAFT_755721 [Acephala macrosclerotiorum]|nr:hypothetical protein BDZ45DRAFT_755721 [Acephala macrosclerotiorum]
MSDSDRSPLPENGHDTVDQDRASDEKDTPPPPAVNPDLDMDDVDNNNKDDDLSDNESELSKVDKAEFAEFDFTMVALEDRLAVSINEDIAPITSK